MLKTVKHVARQIAPVSIRVLSAFAFLCLTKASVAQAQPDTSSYWQKIEQSEASNKAAKIRWLFTENAQPATSAISEEDSEKLAAKLKASGLSDEKIQRKLDNFKKLNRLDSLGYTREGSATFVRRGAELRCDYLASQPRAPKEQSKKEKIRVIEYYDGTTNVSMTGEGSDLPTFGQIEKQSDTVLSYVPAAEQRLILFNLPLSSLFTKEQTIITEDKNDTLILEKNDTSSSSGRPILIRAWVSKRTWRPTKVERLLSETSEIILRVEANNYKLNGGQWLPSEFVATILNPTLTQTYVLQDAKTNDKVTDMDVKITHAPQIVDCRFEGCVGYKWVSGIFPDKAKVEEMKRGEIGPPPGVNTPGGNIPMTMPILAVFLMCLGSGMLITDGRKAKRNNK